MKQNNKSKIQYKKEQNEARKGKNGEIIAKMNSLVDDDVIRALYKASQAGVKIELFDNLRGLFVKKAG